MADIGEFVTVDAVLATASAPQTDFGTELFLVDDDQVPTDKRYIFVTADEYDDLDPASEAYEFAQVYFGQKRQADRLMLGRWFHAAAAPYTVCGDYETDYTTWKAISDGALKFTDSEAHTLTISSIDFSAITALSQVATVLNAKLAALVAPAIVDLEDAEFVFDNFDRLVLRLTPTGASAPTVELGAPAAGTDLSAAAFLDAAGGFVESGMAVELPTAALAAISELDDGWYDVSVCRDMDASEKIMVAGYVESKSKQATFVEFSADAVDAEEDGDIGYLCHSLSYKRSLCIYTAHDDEYPDAALMGCVLPADAGTCEFAKEVLAGVSESGANLDGSARPLTSTEISVLEAKGYNRVAMVGDNVFTVDGITAGGEEKRVLLGKDWFEAGIQGDVFSDMLNQPLSAFDNATLARYEAIVRKWSADAIARGILLDTPAYPFTVDFPDADDFDSTDRASHQMALSQVFYGYLNSSVSEVSITGRWMV